MYECKWVITSRDLLFVPPKASSTRIFASKQLHRLLHFGLIANIFASGEGNTAHLNVGVNLAITKVINNREELRIARSAEFAPCFLAKRIDSNPFLGNDAF